MASVSVSISSNSTTVTVQADTENPALIALADDLHKQLAEQATVTTPAP